VSSSAGAPRREVARWRRLLRPALFLAYCAGYSAFVLVAAFGTFSGGAPSGGLAARGPGGATWGVLAGFGLILGAFVLALVYAAFGAAAEDGDAPGSSAGARGSGAAR
jgi:uncharacterized membrane protein (DUF485 family)